MTPAGPPPPPPPQPPAVPAAPSPPDAPPPPPVAVSDGYGSVDRYEAAYSPDYARVLKRTPSPPSVVSIVVLVVSTVLGIGVALSTGLGWQAAYTTATLMGALGFIGFSWMQDVGVGRRTCATVLATLSVAWSWVPTVRVFGGEPLPLVLVVLCIVAAWVLVRRRSLVALVVLPFALVATVVIGTNISFPPRIGVIGIYGLILSTSAVFVWLAVGIDKLIKNPTVPAAYRQPTPAFVQIGQTPTGEPLYGYATPGPYAHYATSESANTMAVLSLIFGLFGSGIVAVILGHVAHSQIRRTAERGNGMATAGLILGYLAVVVYIAIIAAYAIVIGNAFS